MAVLIYTRYNRHKHWSFSALSVDSVAPDLARKSLARLIADHPEAEVCTIPHLQGMPVAETLPKDASVTIVALQ